MTNSEIVDWIQQEFSPVNLATPDDTIRQIIQNAKRYWNTHSAYPIVRMFDVTSTVQGRLTLTPDYKGVNRVYPSTTPDWVLQNYPMWSLLGITVIDNLTSDLIVLAEAYKNYRYYMGADFNWTFQKSDDPTIAPSLYYSGIPSNSTNICVVGTYRIQETDSEGNEVEIKSEHILDWLLYYVKAQVKMVEGNALRKADAINVKNDGQQLMQEGKEELKELQDKLAVEGRWTAMCRRF